MSGGDETTRKARDEKTAKSSKKLSSNLDIPINPKKQGKAVFDIFCVCERDLPACDNRQ